MPALGQEGLLLLVGLTGRIGRVGGWRGGGRDLVKASHERIERRLPGTCEIGRQRVHDPRSGVRIQRPAREPDPDQALVEQRREQHGLVY